MNTKEEGMAKIDLFKFFQSFSFWTYIKKSQHVHFLIHGHPSCSTFNLHLVRGPKTSVNGFFF
jgi:hypothetical protein